MERLGFDCSKNTSVLLCEIETLNIPDAYKNFKSDCQCKTANEILMTCLGLRPEVTGILVFLFKFGNFFVCKGQREARNKKNIFLPRRQKTCLLKRFFKPDYL